MILEYRATYIALNASQNEACRNKTKKSFKLSEMQIRGSLLYNLVLKPSVLYFKLHQKNLSALNFNLTAMFAEIFAI